MRVREVQGSPSPLDDISEQSNDKWYPVTDDESDNDDSSSDTPSLATPNPYCKPKPKGPRQVQINIDCDQIASETTDIVANRGAPEHMPPTLEPPYPGTRAMLKLAQCSR